DHGPAVLFELGMLALEPAQHDPQPWVLAVLERPRSNGGRLLGLVEPVERRLAPGLERVAGVEVDPGETVADRHRLGEHAGPVSAGQTDVTEPIGERSDVGGGLIADLRAQHALADARAGLAASQGDLRRSTTAGGRVA